MENKAEVKKLRATLAEHIRTQRKLLGLTQEQLAEKAGLSTNYVARLELGSNTPSLSALVALARALEASVSDLLFTNPEQRRSLDAEHIARMLEPLDDRDVHYVLDLVQSSVHYIRSLPKERH